MKQKTSVARFNLSAFALATTFFMGMVVAGRGETYNFLGSTPGSWVGYAGSPVPNLVTSTPGSIADSPSGGSSYARLNTAFSSYPGSWREGDTFAFRFDGVVSNNTALRIEFSNGATTVAGLLGLQFVIVNAAGNNGDSIQINALGGTPTTLFSAGNLGAPAGSPERVIGDITLSILDGNTASVSGSIMDELGNVWTGPSATINLGNAPSTLYAGFNVNSGGGVSGLNNLDWTLTPIPEPGSVALFVGLGLIGLALGRRAGRNR